MNGYFLSDHVHFGRIIIFFLEMAFFVILNKIALQSSFIRWAQRSLKVGYIKRFEIKFKKYNNQILVMNKLIKSCLPIKIGREVDKITLLLLKFLVCRGPCWMLNISFPTYSPYLFYLWINGMTSDKKSCFSFLVKTFYFEISWFVVKRMCAGSSSSKDFKYELYFLRFQDYFTWNRECSLCQSKNIKYWLNVRLHIVL